MRPGNPRQQGRHRQRSEQPRSVGERELDLAHQAAVVLRTQLGLGDVSGTGIGGSQVVEGLGIVLASLVERGAAGEEDGRSDDVHRGNGGDGIGRNLLVAGHAHQAAMEEVTDLLGDLGGVELNALLAIELKGKVDQRRGVIGRRSRRMLMMPIAARRSAYGSDEPVGGSPMAKYRTMVSLCGASHDAASGALG